MHSSFPRKGFNVRREEKERIRMVKGSRRDKEEEGELGLAKSAFTSASGPGPALNL